jgi:uncharacterized membrane protein
MNQPWVTTIDCRLMRAVARDRAGHRRLDGDVGLTFVRQRLSVFSGALFAVCASARGRRQV